MASWTERETRDESGILKIRFEGPHFYVQTSIYRFLWDANFSINIYCYCLLINYSKYTQQPPNCDIWYFESGQHLLTHTIDQNKKQIFKRPRD